MSLGILRYQRSCSKYVCIPNRYSFHIFFSFLAGGGGGGEGGGGLGNFGTFFQKKFWPSLAFYPTFRWLTKVRPSPHYYIVCSKGNVPCRRNLRTFVNAKCFYVLDTELARAETRKCEQSVLDVYVLVKFEYWSILNFEYFKSFGLHVSNDGG